MGDSAAARTDDPIRLLAQLLGSLQAHEYFARKYRHKGDCFAEMNLTDESRLSHEQGAAEEAAAEKIRAQLRDALGGPGRVQPPEPAKLEAIREVAPKLPCPWQEEPRDFDDACFYARYPRWCSRVPKLREAYERWEHDPRFIAAAPAFAPINPTWEP